MAVVKLTFGAFFTASTSLKSELLDLIAATYSCKAAIKAGDKLKDWITDNRLELLAGGKYKSASNLLQKYDDFIQQTVHTPDGKTYVPGYIDADGNVVQRVDATDAFKKEDQNLLNRRLPLRGLFLIDGRGEKTF